MRLMMIILATARTWAVAFCLDAWRARYDIADGIVFTGACVCWLFAGFVLGRASPLWFVLFIFCAASGHLSFVLNNGVPWPPVRKRKHHS